MSTSRPFALVQGGDAWLRAAHSDTSLDLESGVVELDWTTPEPAASGPARAAAGMAFDSGCRLYRSDPAAGQVERTLWGMGRGAPDPVELFEPEPEAPGGDFAPAAPAGGPLRAPRGLAVDEDDRLYVAESGSGRILVFDLWSRRLLRTVPTGPGTRPLDLAAFGRVVLAAVEGLPHLLRLGARDDLEPFPLPPEAPAPDRVAVSPAGAVAVLVAAGTADATVVHVDRPRDALHLAWAGDLEWESEDTLVVARRPGENLLRFRFTHGAVEELRPLAARGYDGTGIVRTPDGRIGFHTAAGFRTAPVARVRYLQNGTVTTFRLDSGDFQTQWGRIFLDACIPSGTSVRVACLTTDEELEGQKLQRGAPGGLVTATPRRPELSPPMPPLALLPEAPEWRPLHRRETGRELPWVQPERGDAFVTYEAPVLAEPGRYLWVTLELRGTSAVSPRFRSLRVEHPGHDLLRRLPRTFAREAPDADFLRRYLALFDGLLHELESRAAARDLLLDPHGTPEDMLPWLASFLGLTLDDRWPVHSRRTLVSEAAWLFRFRGTVAGLRRFLEIYLEQPVVILEQFRLRGMGGGVLGERGPVESRAVLGSGFRVGGAIGDPQQSPLSGTPEDAFETHAHRFAVLVRGALTQEQLDVVQHVLDVHRPAHTLVEVCTVGTGMRVGRGLHLGISSAVGRTGGFSTFQLGAAALGRGGIVGRPEAGTLPGASRLGSDTRVG
ncbi:MAG TPA: phage tail protein [Longimicrobiaceae bacterium]